MYEKAVTCRWETIALATLVFRIFTVPFHLLSVRNTYNMTVTFLAGCVRQHDAADATVYVIPDLYVLQKAKPEVERLTAQLQQEREVQPSFVCDNCCCCLY